MNRTLGVVVGKPPRALRKARLDNIALVPASLLPLRGTYQPLANTLPQGSILLVQSQRHREILENVTVFLRTHGRAVFTLPLEKITRHIPQPTRPKPENLQLAF